MFLRWLLASLHLLALAIGLGAVVVRGGVLASASTERDLKFAFVADNLWGLAAFLWLSTGLLRAFAGLEKGSAYYLGHPLFHAKLGIFILVFALELFPMITLLKWRRVVASGRLPDLEPSMRIARLSYLEAVAVCIILLLATAIARGMGV